MNEFHDPPASDPSAHDPLERLIELFVGQSAPDGPDETTHRRLLAAMTALSEEQPSAPRIVPILAPHKKARWSGWLHVAAPYVAGIAAAILVGLVATLLMLSRPTKSPSPTGLSFDEIVALTEQMPATSTATAEGSATRELVSLLEEYLLKHDGRMPDQEALSAMIQRVLENQELRDLKSWQFARQHFAQALERPNVIGMGVGLLGTLPWTTYGRF